MTKKQDVFALAEKIGATIEIETTEMSFIVRVEAPEGRHWDSEIHEIVECQNRGFSTNYTWKCVLDRMECGTEPCNNNCEWWVD